MSFIKEGSVCVLIMGRRAGEEVTITRIVDENFVMVKTKKGKERKSSMKHLMPHKKR